MRAFSCKKLTSMTNSRNLATQKNRHFHKSPKFEGDANLRGGKPESLSGVVVGSSSSQPLEQVSPVAGGIEAWLSLNRLAQPKHLHKPTLKTSKLFGRKGILLLQSHVRAQARSEAASGKSNVRHSEGIEQTNLLGLANRPRTSPGGWSTTPDGCGSSRRTAWDDNGSSAVAYGRHAVDVR